MPKYKKFVLFFIPVFIIYVTYVFPIYLFTDKLTFDRYLFVPNDCIYGLSILLMIVGRYITFSSVLTIRKSNSQEGDSFSLHTDSLFSLMRNPGLVGLYILFIGIWLAIPSVLFLLGIVFYISYMHFKVLMEEDFLKNRYKQPYYYYFKKTKRYI
ncbi:MAG: methyltransferase [Saprospiraceae bacterium]